MPGKPETLMPGPYTQTPHLQSLTLVPNPSSPAQRPEKDCLTKTQVEMLVIKIFFTWKFLIKFSTTKMDGPICEAGSVVIYFKLAGLA